METQCIQEQLSFQQLGRRAVIGRFDGGKISSDAGGLLLREVERRFGILKRLGGCFRDYRDAERIEHSVESLIKLCHQTITRREKSGLMETQCIQEQLASGSTGLRWGMRI